MHMQFITEVNTIAVDNFSIGTSYNIRFTDETLKTLTCIGKGTDFVMFQDRYPDLLFSLTMTTAASVASIDESSGGTTNYNDLSNKPQINSHTLFGNMSASDLGLVTPSDLSDYVTQDDLDDYATTAAVTAALASKQDVINDLSDIRSGAAAGATAVQPSDLDDYATTAAVTTALAGKQDTLTTAQQTAVDSGITSALVTQIGTNQNNISLIQGDIVSINKVVNWISTTGSINILNATNTTATAPSWIFQNVPCTLQANKEYILRYTTDKGIRLNFVGDKGSTRIFSIIYYASDGAGTFFKKFTPTDDVDKVGLYASELPNGDTAISDMMIYSADLGELNYVPYAPSNIDLYKMIQAL